MAVFVLLTLKYAEVTHRFPQGGGVVTVAAQAINHWVGALGGMFILVGFAGSFLAFSGLESISQLSPVMKTPRKKVAGIALFLVVFTIGLTSPLLTMLSTLLQPREASDPVLSNQLISLLAGHWGSIFLQT